MKDVKKPLYIEYLEKSWTKKRLINSRYSLRAYARFLRIDASALSRVLSRKQELSLSASLKVVKKLELTMEEKVMFLASVLEDKKKRSAQLLANALGNPDFAHALEIGKFSQK